MDPGSFWIRIRIHNTGSSTEYLQEHSQCCWLMFRASRWRLLSSSSPREEGSFSQHSTKQTISSLWKETNCALLFMRYSILESWRTQNVFGGGEGIFFFLFFLPSLHPLFLYPPVMHPPVMHSPLKHPLVMHPPVVHPPVVHPPVMLPPVMHPPVMQPPVMHPPVMQPPVMHPFVLLAPVIHLFVLLPPIMHLLFLRTHVLSSLYPVLHLLTWEKITMIFKN